MSLDWNVKNVKDKDTICWDESGQLNEITEALIWVSIAIGMGTITAKNWKRFFKRVNYFEQLKGPYRQKLNEKEDDYEPVFFTEKEIKAHIGLSTNAQQWSPTIFRKKMLPDI
ncbi:hypothetical protein ACFL35_16855 [Candidatus Riflebacteria bacterium]